MIDAVLPAHYLLELSGSIINTIVPAPFRAGRATIISGTFDNDLLAAAAGNKIVDLICSALPPGTEKTDLIEYNPEFFPLGPAGEAPAEVEEVTEEELLDNPVMLNGAPSLVPTLMVQELLSGAVVTKKFDEAGDFVQLRRTVTGPDFNVTLKICVDPNYYAREKRWQLERGTGALRDAHRELDTDRPKVQ